MTTGIAYQNKDIEFKLFSEAYRERSFRAYGLELPRIKEALPTNLPRVAADEKHMDNLFLLEDGTLAIVDYESEDRVKNRIKYVNYVGRVMERFYRDTGKAPQIRLIVVYTGDVKKAQAVLEMPCMILRMEQVFIAKLPVEELIQRIAHKFGKKAAPHRRRADAAGHSAPGWERRKREEGMDRESDKACQTDKERA